MSFARRKIAKIFVDRYAVMASVYIGNRCFKVTPHDEIADFIIFDIFIDSY